MVSRSQNLLLHESRKTYVFVRLISLVSALVLLMVVGVGCGVTSSTPLSSHRQAVIKGQPDSRHPAVGALMAGQSRSFCTATLIAPSLVLTASHCVDAFGQVGGVSNVFFRTETPQGFTLHAITKATQHPQYKRNSSNLYSYDVAILELSKSIANVTPILANTQAMDATWVGRNVLVMGYGLTQVAPTPRAPTNKQSAEIPIHQVSSASFIHFDQQTKKSACHGDSGGPALMQLQGQWYVMGVTSVAYQARRNPSGNPATLCDGGTRVTRPDVHYQNFILPFIQKHGGSTGCTDGQTRPCYSGPTAARGVGICKEGTETCQGGTWGTCTGAVLPETGEQCGDQLDNNCDGQVDEGCPSCTEGKQQACYTGQADTRGIGICRDGIQNCQNGQWTACSNEILPVAQETCFDQLDNNCNGQVDEGCPDCQNGATQSCYTGPTTTIGVGACLGGTQTCESGVWGLCSGETLPADEETCLDNIDNNCNGQVDEGCIKPDCRAGETQSCYAGTPNTLNIGLCRAGIQFCSQGKWASCTGGILPTPETCDGFDNNCDGRVDEICQKTQSSNPISGPRLRPSGFGCGGSGSIPLVWWLLGFWLSLGWKRHRNHSLSL